MRASPLFDATLRDGFDCEGAANRASARNPNPSDLFVFAGQFFAGQATEFEQVESFAEVNFSFRIDEAGLSADRLGAPNGIRHVAVTPIAVIRVGTNI
jgi:hypothetical protein